MTLESTRTVLVIAPHPDDESLGCGGTLLKHIAQADKVHWLIVTKMSEARGYAAEAVRRRQDEIHQVSSAYGFESTIQLALAPANLDTLPMGDVIGPVSQVLQSIQPDTVYVVYRSDAHTDHQVVFDATMAATKSFRYPFVKEVLCYETISETDFGLRPEDGGFKPNVFVDVSDYHHQKLEILKLYKSELGAFPFPRSLEAIDALAKVRGVQCNARAAEAFMLLKGIR